MNDSKSNLQLEFRDIEYVIKIAECENFSRAAELLHITQPALSIYIKRVESRLGIQLFNRLGKKSVLTYAGKCFLDNGREILKIRDRIEQQINTIKKMDGDRIRIGCTPVRGLFFLSTVVSIFKKKYPQVEIIFNEQPAKELEALLLAGDLDIVFFNPISINDKIEYHEILRDRMVLYMSQQLAKILPTVRKEGFSYPWIDLRILKDEAFIRNYPNQNNEPMVQQIFKDFKMMPRVAGQVSNQPTAINLAAQGEGLYLAMEYFLYSTPLSIKPAVISFGESPDQYELAFVAAVAKDAYCTHMMKEFIALAQKEYRYDVLFKNNEREL